MTFNYEPEEEPPREDYAPTPIYLFLEAPSRGTW